jgi:polar amino acid transport system substrate-binding protein
MKQITTRRFLQFAGLAAAGLLLAACGKKETARPRPALRWPARPHRPGTAGQGLRRRHRRRLRAFREPERKGRDRRLRHRCGQAVAAKAGIEVKFVNTPWEGIFNALGQGDRDMIASAVTITEERKQTMDFSDPYFDAQQLIAVKEGSKVAKFADLKKLKVGVQTGTTGDEAVTKLLGKTSTNIKRFESTPLALKELESGGVDAVVADNGVVIHYVANNPGGKFKTVADKEFVPEQYGIAFKKGNTELQGKVNKGLADIKADGTYAKIYTKYFGARPQQAAASAPAAAASK